MLRERLRYQKTDWIEETIGSVSVQIHTIHIIKIKTKETEPIFSISALQNYVVVPSLLTSAPLSRWLTSCASTVSLAFVIMLMESRKISMAEETMRHLMLQTNLLSPPIPSMRLIELVELFLAHEGFFYATLEQLDNLPDIDKMLSNIALVPRNNGQRRRVNRKHLQFA